MFNEATQLIEDRLTDNWTGSEIDYDNVDFSPVRGIPFVRVRVRWVDTDSVAVGGRDRGLGYVELSIFVASNSGTINATLMADQLAAIYNKWDTGQLKFTVGRTIRVGQQEQWYQLQVLVPFTYDECN